MMSAESAAAQPNFCERCVAESTDKSPKSISTYNGIGRKFYGSALLCAECGSAWRTLWFVFIDLPILPLGSYRYTETDRYGHKYEVMTEKWNFWARRAPMNWPQVLKTWAVGWALAAAIIAAIIALYQI